MTDSAPKSINSTATVIDPTKTHKIAEFKHELPLTTGLIDPLSRYVFAGAEDLNVYRWDVASGKKSVLSGHESWVRSMEFSSNGETLYTAGWDGRVGFWDVAAEKPIAKRMLQAHDGWCRWVRVNRDGTLMATCGNDNLVKVWDAANASLIHVFPGHKRHVYSVAFHPFTNELVSFDLMGVVKIWDLDSGTGLGTIDASVMQGYDNKFAADMGGARDMRFSADGTRLACAGITNVRNAFAGVQTAIVQTIDWMTGKLITKHGGENGNYEGIAWGTRFHPDGYVIGSAASRGSGGVVWFWKPDSEKPFHTVKLKKGARGLDMTPDAKTLAIPETDGCLRLYRMTDAAKT